eukprot:CAMPEP_0118633702 /NCGR_PEP_ID=MMETSP0785-20121206/1141_1 /TAXON_ID=91992 /ORGANISM="Bolidomonas pacifica, Strain CCMP 1866" /LENGTH=210 /DNA_ID=CAMNT_0006524601 /DNA_START=18 /DNA_END=647 /DNA_ORIENTATION=-
MKISFWQQRLAAIIIFTYFTVLDCYTLNFLQRFIPSRSSRNNNDPQITSLPVIFDKGATLRNLLLTYEPSTTTTDAYIQQVLGEVEILEKSFADEVDNFNPASLEGEWELLFTCNIKDGSYGDVSAQGLKFPTDSKLTTQEIIYENGGIRIKNRIVDRINAESSQSSSSSIIGDVEVGGEINLDNRVNVNFDSSTIEAFSTSVDLSFLFK